MDSLRGKLDSMGIENIRKQMEDIKGGTEQMRQSMQEEMAELKKQLGGMTGQF